MTKLMKLAAFVLFVQSGLINAQVDPATLPVATITSEFCVQLDAGQSIQEMYAIDITPFGFATESEAFYYFGAMSCNLLTYTVDIPNQVAILEVHTDRTTTLNDVNWWNDFLTSRCGS